MGGCVSDCTQRDVQVLAPPEETSLDLQNLGSIVPTGRAIFLGPAPVEPRDSPDFVPLDIAYLHCCGYRAKLWLRMHERTSASAALVASLVATPRLLRAGKGCKLLNLTA